jgi:CheY-like chemotaxis protein
MPEGGAIDVKLRTVDESGNEVELSVTDTGKGIPLEIQDRLFEPFFTTKGMGRGTGLGLASVYGATAQLGGTVSVESKPGGTIFEVHLPSEPHLGPRSVSLPVTSQAPPRRILVVDDDAQVRSVTARMLRDAGHEVRQATDGDHALSMLKQEVADIVLTDVVMPKMGGVELARRISLEHPTVDVLLTSGYPADHLEDLARVHFLPKPFDRTSLVRRIAELATRTLREGVG